MRNNVLGKISEKFIEEKDLYLLLGDLGVFQSREAIKIDNYRCINYGIMEQSMIGFASGISQAGQYPIVYSITPFIIERCFEQLKLDFGYNDCNGLIITAGGSFDYNKLGPTHFCPNDISLIFKTNCRNIFLPWNKYDAEKFTEKILQEKCYAYLRLSSEEICNEDMPKDFSHLKKYSEKITIGIGPDSLLIAKHLKFELNYSISNFNEETVRNLKKLLQEGLHIELIAGFNLDFLLNLLNNHEESYLSSGSLKLIYSITSKFDTAEEKITHLLSNLISNSMSFK